MQFNGPFGGAGFAFPRQGSEGTGVPREFILIFMETGRANDEDHSDCFATTQWSIVLAAGRHDDGESRAALAALCQNYWQPVYGFVRRRAASVEAARDLTQEFFFQLLEREALAVASPERGRFRAFLLTSLKNFLATERKRERAQKRGGGRPQLSLDWATAESRMSWEPADPLTPERRFERQWATTLLERVVEQLREEMVAAGQGGPFDVLKAALARDQDRLPYADVAAALDCSPEAARQAAHRLRKRYRELLRAEIAQTVADVQEVDDEIRRLFAVFGD
jgi:RNA polymerase sigma-70 factor (ECF subfamily)